MAYSATIQRWLPPDKENYSKTLCSGGTQNSKWDVSIKSFPSELRKHWGRRCRGSGRDKEWRTPGEQGRLKQWRKFMCTQRDWSSMRRVFMGLQQVHCIHYSFLSMGCLNIGSLDFVLVLGILLFFLELFLIFMLAWLVQRWYVAFLLSVWFFKVNTYRYKLHAWKFLVITKILSVSLILIIGVTHANIRQTKESWCHG